MPDHQIKLGGLARIGRYVSVGADGRYIGKQYLRGDEANVTDQLDGYFVADARVGVEFGRWEINGIVTNLFQNKSAIFGTFNINQGNPAGLTVERFLTPNHRRAFRLVVRTTLGGRATPTEGGRRRGRGVGRGVGTFRLSVLSVFSVLYYLCRQLSTEYVLKIAVCIKRVPDMEMRFSIAADGKSLDQSGLKCDMGDFDGYALEVGLQLAEKHGPARSCHSLGPDGVRKRCGRGWRMGADARRAAQGRRRAVDGLAIAKALAAELKDGGYDLILFGRMATDTASGTVGPMTAELLDLPCVTSISQLEIADGRAPRGAISRAPRRR